LYIDFEGRHAEDRNHEDGQLFQVVKNWVVVIGDKDLTPALEMGLRFMRDGETSLIYSDSKYAYGVAGRKQDEYVLPPNTKVMYRVRITKLIPGDSDLFHSPSFQIKIAQSKKCIGNDCYQFEWADGHGKGKALMLYKQASDAMVNLMTENEDENIRKEASAIFVDCLNNVSAVYLKAKEYGKAKEAATKVILHDPDNMKALLRAARAALYDPAGTFEESAAAIAAAEQVDPDDVDLRKLKIELGRKKKEYKAKIKAMFAKMSTAIVDTGRALTGEGIADNEQSAHNDTVGSPLVRANIEPDNFPSVEMPSAGTAKSELLKYLPLLFQIVLPFLTYYLFSFMKQNSEAE
jgi:tetratricopeptide (TPR) repeat protein